MSFLETILACPRCKTAIKPNNSFGKCPKCKIEYKKKGGIWHFLYIPIKESKDSLLEYNAMHKGKFGGPTDGSYEILASIARGNKTVDIACGQGHIEKLSPETVGVEFSLEALKKAKANGGKLLVLADAHALPFKNDSFDIAISAGNLEHFINPQKAINEMARVAKIQVLTVHRYPSIPFASAIYTLVSKFLRISHQPIEQPIHQKNLEKMIVKARLHIVFNGLWTLPVNYGRPIKLLPELERIPSCSFIISIKK